MTTPPRADEGRAWWWVAPALFAAAWGGNHFTPLLVHYTETVGYSVAEVDLFFATYVFGLVPGFLFAGRLSDRYGRKLVLLVGVVIGVAGSGVLAAGADSALLLAGGRFVAGASVATAMVAATSWIKELSPVGARGARRAAVTMTLAFGLGAVLAGVLVQWAPYPNVLPYVVHVVLCLVALGPLSRTAERRPVSDSEPLLPGIRLGVLPRRRLLRVVLPAAPWVFAGPAAAMVVAPVLLADAAAGYAVLVSAGFTLATLGPGVLVQPLVPLIAQRTRGRQAVVSLAAFVAGVGLLELAVVLGSLTVGALSAAVFGVSYGVGMVAGLMEVQELAPPHALGLLTGVYYSLTYGGFFLPLALALAAGFLDYSALLLIVALVCAACLALVERELRRT